MKEEHKIAIQVASDAIKAFEASDAVKRILAAQRSYRAALQSLLEARIGASIQVNGILDRVEDCLKAMKEESAKIPWDEENRPKKDESLEEISELIFARTKLELCVAGLQIRDFDLDEDIEKDTLCIMDEAREALSVLAGESDEGEPVARPQF